MLSPDPSTGCVVCWVCWTVARCSVLCCDMMLWLGGLFQNNVLFAAVLLWLGNERLLQDAVLFTEV